MSRGDEISQPSEFPQPSEGNTQKQKRAVTTQRKANNQTESLFLLN